MQHSNVKSLGAVHRALEEAKAVPIHPPKTKIAREKEPHKPNLLFWYALTAKFNLKVSLEAVGQRTERHSNRPLGNIGGEEAFLLMKACFSVVEVWERAILGGILESKRRNGTVELLNEVTELLEWIAATLHDHPSESVAKEVKVVTKHLKICRVAVGLANFPHHKNQR